MADDSAPVQTVRWWLNLQVTFAMAGGAVWFAGAMVEQDFVAGAGCGLIVAALLLRLGRGHADDAG